MLSKTCPVCHSPLFEVKGETLCVVCKEEQEVEDKSSMTRQVPVVSPQKGSVPGGQVAPGGLEDEFSMTLRSLLIQVREEQDSARILTLMDAVKRGAEAYTLLLYGYGRRDNS